MRGMLEDMGLCPACAAGMGNLGISVKVKLPKDVKQVLPEVPLIRAEFARFNKSIEGAGLPGFKGEISKFSTVLDRASSTVRAVTPWLVGGAVVIGIGAVIFSTRKG